MINEIYDTDDSEINRIDKPLFNDPTVIRYSKTQHDTNRYSKQNQSNTDNKYENKSECTSNTMNQYKEANRNAMINEIYDTDDGEINRIDKPLLNDPTVIRPFLTDFWLQGYSGESYML